MKKKSIITSLILLVFITSCEQNIFGPNEGSLEGTITDNNGNPVQGAKITAKHIKENEEGVDNLQEKTVNITSDAAGFYRFEKIPLTEHEIIVEKNGLEDFSQFIILSQSNISQTLNASLNGSPTIKSTSFSPTAISIAANDNSTINITVNDVFNETQGDINYSAKCLLYKGTVLETIIDLPLLSNSSTLFVFEKQIQATSLDSFTYDVTFEIIDPDRQTSSRSIGTFTVNN